MITKIFKRKSLFSLTLSAILIAFIAYNYSQSKITWSLFQSQWLNFLLFFGIMIMTLRAYSFEMKGKAYVSEKNKNAFYLLMYPLIILSFPYETIDVRLLLCPALIYNAVFCISQYSLSKKQFAKTRILLLIDTIVLITLASFLIVENAIFLVFLLLGLFWTGSRLVLNEILLIIIVPIILSFTAHTFLSLFNYQDLLFTSFIFDNNHVIVNNINWEFFYANKYLFLLIFIFIYAMILAITRKYRYQERAYISRRIFFAIIVLITIILVSPTYGMEFHYLGLVMVYFMEYFYRKHSNKIFLNFFFVSLIISYLLFTFVIK